MNYLIIGSGVAAISAVKEILKNRSDNDSIRVVSDEKYPFYYRPRLIHCLSGEVEVDDIIINDKQWFEDNDINLHLEERVNEVKIDNKIVVTEKSEYKFDKLLLANGAHSFLPPVSGANEENVFTLRSAEDAEEIYKVASKSEKAVVIGGGLLGLESAYYLSKAGLEVKVMERGSYLLKRQLDKHGGEILQELLEDKGIDFVLNANTKEIISEKNSLEVLEENKGSFNTDLILFSTGIRSNTELVENTEININRGIIVNNKMETSVDNIYAAGDVAEYDGRVYGIWPPSMEEGKIAGKNMVDNISEFNGFVSSYSLKVAGISLVSKGIVDDEENYKVEKEEKDGKYKKIIYDGDKVVGIILIGDFSNKKELVNMVE